MIAFEVLFPTEINVAVEAMVLTAHEGGRTLDFEIGPFDDSTLLGERKVFVTGPDEIEAAELLGSKLLELGVRFRAL